MQFLECQVLDARNLLCCTTRFDHENFMNLLAEIDEQITSQGISRQNATTFLIFNDEKNQTINAYVSLNKKMENLPSRFWIRERIHLEQAVKTRYEGDLFGLGESFSGMKKYLEKRRLTPITPFCCRVMAGLTEPHDTENTIIDVYIGVNVNII